MRRRDFVKYVVASLSAYPFAATAQRSIPVIGALSPAARPTQFNSSVYASFSLGMRELGYVEGKDYSIEWRFADGDYARLPELANELIALKVDVLFATSTAAILAAHYATNSIPIVMGYYEDDPAAEHGLVASLAQPGWKRHRTSCNGVANRLEAFGVYKGHSSRRYPPRRLG